MSWDGNTVSVTKRCVALEDCLETGCSEMDHEGNKVRYNSHLIKKLLFQTKHIQFFCFARPAEIHPHLSSHLTSHSALEVILKKTRGGVDKHICE